MRCDEQLAAGKIVQGHFRRDFSAAFVREIVWEIFRRNFRWSCLIVNVRDADFRRECPWWIIRGIFRGKNPTWHRDIRMHTQTECYIMNTFIRQSGRDRQINTDIYTERYKLAKHTVVELAQQITNSFIISRAIWDRKQLGRWFGRALLHPAAVVNRMWLDWKTARHGSGQSCCCCCECSDTCVQPMHRAHLSYRSMLVWAPANCHAVCHSEAIIAMRFSQAETGGCSLIHGGVDLMGLKPNP